MELAKENIAPFLHKACEDRLAFLRTQASATWDGVHFSLADLDAFMDSTRVANIIGRVRTPLILVSARDDPAVGRWMFEEVVSAAADNAWIVAYETEHGGHFGFDVAYGKGYVRRIIDVILDPYVLSTWNAAVAEERVPR